MSGKTADFDRGKKKKRSGFRTAVRGFLGVAVLVGILGAVNFDVIKRAHYVLTGGELPAMVMIDAIARLVPGVLHNGESAQTESFGDGLLEYPQYSRPEVWHEKRVPEILLSGDHAKVDAWRLEQSLLRTKERRPDLYAKYQEAHAAKN